MSVAPLFCIACDVTADKAIGTSDRGLARRGAVTMMLTFSESTADPLSCAHATGTLLPNAMATEEISKRKEESRVGQEGDSRRRSRGATDLTQTKNKIKRKQ